jgi:four helix bundle protein
MEQNKIIKELIEKTFAELNQSEKPVSRSRVWKSSNGYIFLVAWSNASLLRILAAIWFTSLKSANSPLTSLRGMPFVNRLEAQLLDALRSVIANIEEGFARPNTSSYLEFLGFSQASLKEAKGDFQRARQDGFLTSKSASSLKDLKISLKDWHEALKKSVISNPLETPDIRNYRMIKDIKGDNITYEMFIELVNKTDWNLRKLVESLEQKLNSNKLGYKVEQARIKDWSKGGKK